MKDGRRLQLNPGLAEIRALAANDLERLPQPLRELTPGATYPVEVADALVRRAADVDARITKSEGAPPALSSAASVTSVSWDKNSRR